MKISNLLRWLPPETGSRWDQVKIYRSTAEAGTFSVVKTLDVCYSFYWDEDGTSTSWYKLAFYDSVGTVESLPTDAFNGATVPIISPKELRTFMAFSDTQLPDDTTLLSLIVDANTELGLDVTIGTTSAKKLALKFLASAFACQWRANQILGAGNVNFAIDGVSVQKPFQQWTERAKEFRQLYDDFVWKYCDESMITTPIADAGYEDQATYYVEILHGITNAQNMQDYGNNPNNVAYVEDGA